MFWKLFLFRDNDDETYEVSLRENRLLWAILLDLRNEASFSYLLRAMENERLYD